MKRFAVLLAAAVVAMLPAVSARATPASHDNPLLCAGVPETFSGTNFDDFITQPNATSGNDVIGGHGGNDTIFSGPGDDLDCGGNGADTIFGGDDSDTIYGGNGLDHLVGNGDTDYIYGYRFQHSGDTTSDEFWDGEDKDWIFGGAGPSDILWDCANDFGDVLEGIEHVFAGQCNPPNPPVGTKPGS